MVSGLLAMALLQVGVGNARVFVPLLPMAAFYFAVAYGWRRVSFGALVIAALLDASLGHPGFPAVLTALAAVVLADFWHRHGNCRLWIAQAVPGVLVGGWAAVVHLVFEYVLVASPGIGGAARDAGLLVWTAFVGAAVLPVVVWAFDSVADRLRLRLFRDARPPSVGFSRG